jgi:hypothetical protein
VLPRLLPFLVLIALVDIARFATPERLGPTGRWMIVALAARSSTSPGSRCPSGSARPAAG